MKFGKFSLNNASGGILAHSVKLPDDTVIRKGTVLDDDLVDLLLAASLEEVVIAMPEPGDVGEDEAALRIAKMLECGGLRTDKAKTGRVNFFAKTGGLFRVDRLHVDAINAIDEAVTFATLPDMSEVNEGRMVATVKIIPLALPVSSIEAISGLQPTDVMKLEPYRSFDVGVIFTQLPALKQSVLDKTRRVLERRLVPSGSQIVSEVRTSHQIDALTEAIEGSIQSCDMLVIFGASAIADIDDVIPSAVRAAGGTVKRFGMPVDPGNLLLLAELGGKPVIGAPGCARSPAENGFDWVLQRLLCSIPVGAQDLAAMGVGGLLMETGARPHPREPKSDLRKGCAAIILAAGQSRRMGKENKLLMPIEGEPMLRQIARVALESDCESVFVVTGHEADKVTAALEGLDVSFVHNPDYEEGLSSSLKNGISAVGNKFQRALLLLGDMPFIRSEMIDRLCHTSAENPDSIIVATCNGKRGNPVVWPSAFFADLQRIEGDVGARHIIGANSERVIEVETGKAAAIDLDTPEAVQKYAIGRDPAK